MSKKSFIENEIWILTFAGGFQRAKIYTGAIDEKQRSAYRQLLRDHIEKLVEKHYQKNVSDAEHLEHINSIITFSNSQKAYKENVKMNFGIAQKLLNLYLKYLWCLGELKIVPPHFPVDRRIQELLKFFPIISWTKDLNSSNYMELIEKAKLRAAKDKISIAQLELEEFKRSNEK